MIVISFLCYQRKCGESASHIRQTGYSQHMIMNDRIGVNQKASVDLQGMKHTECFILCIACLICLSHIINDRGFMLKKY